MAEESSGFDWQSFFDTLNANHVPAIFLLLVGIVALVIVYTYLKDKDSPAYRTMMLIGVIFGVIMVILCVATPMKTAVGTTIVVAIGAFALIIRPFRDVHFAVIIALLGMVLAYILLGSITAEPFDVLNDGWPRIIAAFVIGSVIYMMLNFLQEVVLTTAKILNAWPVLILVGVICILEAICLFTGHDSVYDTIISLFNSNKEILLI